MRCFPLLIGLAARALAQSPDPVHLAFERLYNVDFEHAHQILDREIRSDPQRPLLYSVKSAAYLFGELNRLKILEVDFFLDDDRVIDRHKLTADPQVREALFQTIRNAQRLGDLRLASRPDDREAMFAMCMAASVETDYAALVERRRFGSFPLAKRTHAWARRLVALDPPCYDAYMTYGSIEYVVGSLPFFLRWFVHIDQIKGSKQQGIHELEMVAQHGQYYGPYARILLAVIHSREKRPQMAEKLLAGLAAEYPENGLIRKELARARSRQAGAAQAR